MVLGCAHAGSAVSEEASQVRQYAAEMTDHVTESRALFEPKSMVISDFRELIARCSTDNWDGYGALPVKGEIAERVIKLLYTLPESIRLPEVSIEPDGEVCLDWIGPFQRTISLSIGESDRIAYAWLDGTNRGHAVDKLTEEGIPNRILNQIMDIVGYEPVIGIA